MQKSVMTYCMIVIRWGSMTVTGERKFEKRIGSPVRIRTYNPLVNSLQNPTQKSKVCDLFFAGIRGTDGKGQQLACPGRAVLKLCDEVAEAARGERSCWRKSGGR